MTLTGLLGALLYVAPEVVAPVAAAAATTTPTGLLTAPDEASARASAKLSGQRVQVDSELTGSSTTYVNPDGTVTTDSFAGPIRVPQPDGSWADVDTTLVMAKDGSVAPKMHPAGLVLSAAGGTAATQRPIASMGSGASSVQWLWTGPLPTPTLAGDTATYANVQPGVDLVLKATRTGLEQSFVLRTKPTRPLSFSLPIKVGSGLTVGASDNGNLEFKSKDGKVVGSSGQPVMWDSQVDPNSGEHVRQLSMTPVLGKPSASTLPFSLVPDATFLADPATKYPVTVDPSVTLYPYFDTFVEGGYTTDQSSSTDLKLGYNGAGDVARSFITFNTSGLRSKIIKTATLSLWNYHSWSCTAAPWEVWDTGLPSTSSRWTAQPAWNSSMSTSSATTSDSGTCSPPGWVTQNVLTLAQVWANRTTTYNALGLRASDEAAQLQWKRFNSGDASTNIPKLSVTYNSRPNPAVVVSASSVQPGQVYGATRFSASTTPTLTATSSDPDGSTVRLTYEVWAGSSPTPTTMVVSAQTAYSATGTPYKMVTPLTEGGVYEFRAAVYDGTDWNGTWSPWQVFTVDSSVPASAPTVSSATYPGTGSWNGAGGTAGTFTFTPAGADTSYFYYSLDGVAPVKVNGNLGSAVTASITPLTDGSHKLTVYSTTKAAVASPITTYAFNVGSGAVTLPLAGDRRANTVVLQASGKSTFDGVKFQFRKGAADPLGWQDVNPANVKKQNGTTLANWTAGSVAFTTVGQVKTTENLTWDAFTQLGADAAIDIRAEFTTGGTGPADTVPVTFTLDRRASSAATEQVGPGSVNLLNGDFSLSSTDTSMFGASVSRSANSLFPTQATSTTLAQPFGPAWATGMDSSIGSDYTAIKIPSASETQLVMTDGSSAWFYKVGTKWLPEPGSEDLALTSVNTTTWTLLDADGTLTTFTGATTGPFTVSSVVPAGGAAGTTKLVYTSVTIGANTVLELTKIIAPSSAFADIGASCNVASPPAGCRVLELVYAPGTTTPPTGTNLGDYPNRVSAIRAWLSVPGTTASNTPAATATEVSHYTYDLAGNLREQWDPRISPALKTTYTYDTGGRIATVTGAGQQPWTMAYDTNTDPNFTGRLFSASRPTLAAGTVSTTNGTNTVNVVYQVPLSGTGAPYPMSATDTATWGQLTPPYTASAIFPGDITVSGHYGALTGTNPYQYATVHYLDPDGKEVNSADPGGSIDATWLDTKGNTIQQLSAGNRALALATSASPALWTMLGTLNLQGVTTDQRAYQLSDLSTYADDGYDINGDGTSDGNLRQTDTYGPLHQITLSAALTVNGNDPAYNAGDVVLARDHTQNTYDTGRTAGTGPRDLTTRVDSGAAVTTRPNSTDADVRSTTTTYDWAKGLALTSTQDPSGANLTGTTHYDTAGRVDYQLLPGSATGTAGQRVTTYWNTAGACAGHPEWADLVCQTAAGGAITGGGTNPTGLVTTTVQYAQFGGTSLVTEVANTVTRTTTTTFDTAGRTNVVTVCGNAACDSAGALGTAVTKSKAVYDTSTGQVTATQALDATDAVTGQILTTFDSLGRQLSYTDATGAETDTTYDALDRVATRAIKQLGTTPNVIIYLRTTTSTYDRAVDPRGMLTSTSETKAGAYAATYDLDGKLVTQTMPGGVTMTQGFDPSGSAVSRSYSDGTNTLFAETVVPQASGQSGTHARTTVGGSTHQGYSYDGVGRLTGLQDQVGDLCSARSYAFDAHSNRTVLLATTGSPGDVACPALPSTSGVTAQHTFDTGDRLVDTGYVYDAFGRATATPNQLTNSYFVNDLIHSQVAVVGSGSTAITTTQTWSLEPGGRFGSFTIAARDALGAVVGTDATKVNHYDDPGDSPTFIEEGDGTITHMFTAPDGDVAMLTNRDGNRRLQLANLHGDIAVQIPEDNAFAFAITVNAPVKEFDADEYGNPRAVGTDVQNVDGTWDLTPVSVRTQPRYGWLGSKQRSTEAQGGVILMGVRLYDPTLGRFLSADPVYGGNPNPYIYPTDPINAFDLNGKSAGIGPSYQHCYTNCHSYSRSCAWTCMKHWASRTSHHVVVSVGGCAVVCASLSYQGGHLSWGLGGTGFSVPYPAIGYSRLRARKRLNGWYAFGNLFGAYYSHHSNNGYSQRNNYEVGLGKIGWGFAFGGMYSHHLFTAPWAD